MRRTGIFVRCALATLLVAGVGRPAFAQKARTPEPIAKIDRLTQRRIQHVAGWSRVIVQAVDRHSRASLGPIIAQAGGRVRRTLSLIDAEVIDLPNASLTEVASSPLIARIALDRFVVGAMERTGATVGATAVRQELGYDGSGVGVAIIDSGVTSWHDDLTDAAGAQRVHHFVDFVNGGVAPYDDYGHGTHIAGIVAGNGFDSAGARSGIALAAHLIVLKTLDASGSGYVSNVIAALDYIVANRDAFNIRVVNLSIAADVYESYNTDPLTLAAKRAVEAGIVVVTVAGNRGRNVDGLDTYGGITAPGNAPWVLTVGASSHMGTSDRTDDAIAAFSSRGPTAIDYAAKPDIVAPGVGIESLSDPISALYATKTPYLLSGTALTAYLPYLSLSGTSMAAPVVSGTVALMLQANPTLTPNQVKAILQYTAQVYPAYDPLTEGAGFLNAKGAVELSLALATPSLGLQATPAEWSGRLIWGTQLVSGGRLTADANAWGADVTWGTATTSSGESVVWGTSCNTPACDDGAATLAPWTVDASAHNVVWGLTCGGADCEALWTIEAVNAVESVVWGTTSAESVVWGTIDAESVVWGTSCSDPACEPVIWPNQ
jgi:serine protease AprX